MPRTTGPDSLSGSLSTRTSQRGTAILEQCIGATCAINRICPFSPSARPPPIRSHDALVVFSRSDFGRISTLPVSAVRNHARKHAAAYQRRHEFDSCLSAQCSIQTPSNSGIIRRRCGIAPFDFRPCRIPTQKRQESTPQSILARTANADRKSVV